ncbi:MAG: hypothetical protein KH006_03470 [Firmicutes bacterium]|nr:hypothetical protein [Bacillota bacterium]
MTWRRRGDDPTDLAQADGRDGHMLTERVDMRQTFRNVPNITRGTILRLLG